MKFIDNALLYLDESLISLCKSFYVRPNNLTLFRIILIAPTIWLYLNGHIAIAGVVFFFAAILDAFDGPMARAHGKESKIGGVLDPLADKLLFLCTLYLF